jgi:hypothetical protein
MKIGFLQRIVPATAVMLSAGFGEPIVKHESTRIGAWIDAGQVVKGKVDNGAEVDMQVITRSKVALVQQATINERLLLTGALGGLFFYSLPVDRNGPHTRLTKFTAVLEEASAVYKFGDVEKPVFDTKFGLFFEKYNPDAKNLGEYLFRSGAYPGYLQTGGWYILNSAGYFLQGIKGTAHFMDGALDLSAFLYMERDLEPTYDLTPALMATYKAGNAFELGLGVAFNHAIPAKPSITTPENGYNGYVTDPVTGKVRLLTFDESQDTIPPAGIQFYTFKGTKISARASFSPQAFLNSDMLNPEDLRLYAEVAVLGVKNYPIYYDNMAKRMPIMFGLNLPTFKLVDKMSFEVEYYDTPFKNSIEEVYERTLPVPGTIGGVVTQARQNYVDSLSSRRELRDKVKWTFWMQKEVTAGLGLTFQVASDHFRPMNFNLKPAYEPVTQTWNDWYYMFRVNFGI